VSGPAWTGRTSCVFTRPSATCDASTVTRTVPVSCAAATCTEIIRQITTGRDKRMRLAFMSVLLCMKWNFAFHCDLPRTNARAGLARTENHNSILPCRRDLFHVAGILDLGGCTP